MRPAPPPGYVDCADDLLISTEKAGPDPDEVILAFDGEGNMRVLSARREWLRQQRPKKSKG